MVLLTLVIGIIKSRYFEFPANSRVGRSDLRANNGGSDGVGYAKEEGGAVVGYACQMGRWRGPVSKVTGMRTVPA